MSHTWLRCHFESLRLFVFFRGRTAWLRHVTLCKVTSAIKTSNRNRGNGGIVNTLLISFYCLLRTNSSFVCIGFAGDSSLRSHLLRAALFVLHAIQNADSICAFPLLRFSLWNAVLIWFGFEALNTHISLMFLAFLFKTEHFYSCLPAIVPLPVLVWIYVDYHCGDRW